MSKNNTIRNAFAAATLIAATLGGATAVQAQTTASALDESAMNACATFLGATHRLNSHVSNIDCRIYENPNTNGVKITFKPRNTYELDRYNMLEVGPGYVTVMSVTKLNSDGGIITYTTNTGNQYKITNLNDKAAPYQEISAEAAQQHIPADVLATLKSGIALEKKLSDLKLGESADPSSGRAYNMISSLTREETEACQKSMRRDGESNGEYRGATAQINCWTSTSSNGPRITFHKANGPNNSAELIVTPNSVKLTVSEEERSTKSLDFDGIQREVNTSTGSKMAISALAPPVQEALSAGENVRRIYIMKSTAKPAGFTP